MNREMKSKTLKNAGIINKKHNKPWLPSNGRLKDWGWGVGCSALLLQGSLGSKHPETQRKSWALPPPWPAPGTISFPRGGREQIPCRRAPPPPHLLRKARLSRFVRNVQFLWQNKPSNSHAVQAKLQVFKCGESG